MQEIRCKQYNKKLAQAKQFKQLEIKCPRCKLFNNLSATSTADRRGTHDANKSKS